MSFATSSVAGTLAGTVIVGSSSTEVTVIEAVAFAGAAAVLALAAREDRGEVLERAVFMDEVEDDGFAHALDVGVAREADKPLLT